MTSRSWSTTWRRFADTAVLRIWARQRETRMKDNSITRRDFLHGMTAAALGTLAAGEAKAGEPVRQPAPTADACILLWMAGGMAAPETFDPKRYTPFEVGVPANRILCTFPSIPTAVDGIRISEGLENIAGVMDRAT